MARDTYSFIGEKYLRYENGLPLLKDEVLKEVQRDSSYMYIYGQTMVVDHTDIRTVMPHPQGPWTLVKIEDKWYMNVSKPADWERHLNELQER